MNIQELNAKKEVLKIEVAELVLIKNRLYSNIDIESPMTNDEKALNAKIAGIYSEINAIVRKKRSLK